MIHVQNYYRFDDDVEMVMARANAALRYCCQNISLKFGTATTPAGRDGGGGSGAAIVESLAFGHCCSCALVCCHFGICDTISCRLACDEALRVYEILSVVLL